MFKVKKAHYLFIALMSCSSILEGATQSINLRQVVKEGQHAVEALITKVGVDYQDQDGTTLAMWATCFNNRKLLRFLVNDKKADLTKQTYKKGNTALIIALGKPCNRKIDLDTINCFKEFAEKGIDIGLHVANKAKDTPLLKAIYNIGDEEKLLKVVQSLVKSGAKVTSEFSSPNTPLVLCCDKGYKRVVEYLLSQDNSQEGYLKDWKNGYGDTPLTMAATRNYPDLIKMLCEKLSLDDNQINAGIEAAIQHWNFEIAAYLIDREESSWSAEQIKELVENLASSIPTSFSSHELLKLNLLIKVLAFGEIKKNLKPEEISFRDKDKDGQVFEFSFLEYLICDPYSTGRENKRLRILDIIIQEENIDLTKKGNMLIVTASDHGQFNIVRYLLEQEKIKWTPEHKEEANAFALSLARAGKYKFVSDVLKIKELADLIDLNKVIKLLISHIKDPFDCFIEQQKRGMTVLVGKWPLSTFKLLVDIYKANPNQQSEEGITTALMIVAINNSSDSNYSLIRSIVEEIPESEALINAQNEDGMTVLMLLTQDKGLYLSGLDSSHQELERVNLQIIKYLVENNANTQLKNKDHKTAYDLALEVNHQKIAAYLQSLAPTNIERNQNDGDNGQVGGIDNSTQANDDNSQGGIGNDNSTQADSNSIEVNNDNSQGVGNDNSTQADDSNIQANINNYQGGNRDNSIEPNDRNNRGNNHHLPNSNSSNDSLHFLVVVGVISIIIAIAAEVPYYFEKQRKRKSSPKPLINS